MYAIEQSDVEDVKRWKLHYGLRCVGKTEDGKNVVSGLDTYKLTSSLGIDLDFFLMKMNSSGCVVDWIGYAKAATIEGWLIQTIIGKIKYPVTENYGERHWEEVQSRIRMWFVKYMS